MAKIENKIPTDFARKNDGTIFSYATEPLKIFFVDLLDRQSVYVSRNEHSQILAKNKNKWRAEPEWV